MAGSVNAILAMVSFASMAPVGNGTGFVGALADKPMAVSTPALSGRQPLLALPRVDERQAGTGTGSAASPRTSGHSCPVASRLDSTSANQRPQVALPVVSAIGLNLSEVVSVTTNDLE